MSGSSGRGIVAKAADLDKSQPSPSNVEGATDIGKAPDRTIPVYVPPTSTSEYAHPIPQYQPAHATDFGGLTVADLQDYSDYIRSLNTQATPPATGLAELYDAYYRATGRRLGE